MKPEQATSKWNRRQVLLIGGAAVVVGMGVAGAVLRATANTPGDRKLCAENLQAIGRACISYANSHQGSFPPSLKELTRAGGAEALWPEQLSCPNAGKKGRGGDFVYVPGLRKADEPTTILVYEPLGNHMRKPGGHVLLVNGIVNWLDENPHKAAVAQVKAPQARAPASR